MAREVRERPGRREARCGRIANLAPRQIRGLESQGMVLAAEHEGVVAPLTPAKDGKPGAGIK